jgi:hypothetical protein
MGGTVKIGSLTPMSVSGMNGRSLKSKAGRSWYRAGIHLRSSISGGLCSSTERPCLERTIEPIEVVGGRVPEAVACLIGPVQVRSLLEAGNSGWRVAGNDGWDKRGVAVRSRIPHPCRFEDVLAARPLL